MRLVLRVGRLLEQIAETLKLVEDDEIRSDLLERGNRESAPHGGNQFKAVVRVDEGLYSRRQMLPALYTQLDAQRIAECRAERAIGDFPVPDRISIVANPAPEPLWPHIDAKGALWVDWMSES